MANIVALILRKVVLWSIARLSANSQSRLQPNNVVGITLREKTLKKNTTGTV